MKKLVIFLLIIFLTTGCSNEYHLYFKDNEIKSIININFTLDEYTNNYLKTNSNYDNTLSIENKEKQLKYDIESLLLPAYINNNEFNYIQSKFITSNNNYELEYTFFYDYNNFNNNYYLNKCFENNYYEELDNAYYYRFTGRYKCDYNNMKLIVTSENSLVNNNSDIVNDKEYIWNIKKDSNDIEFSVNKEKNTKVINSFDIIIYIIVGILFVITFFLYLNVKKKY